MYIIDDQPTEYSEFEQKKLELEAITAKVNTLQHNLTDTRSKYNKQQKTKEQLCLIAGEIQVYFSYNILVSTITS